jgi:hypothetical protein
VVSGSLGRTGCPDAARLESGAPGRPLPAGCLETLSGPGPEDGRQTEIISGSGRRRMRLPGASAPWAAVTLSDTEGSGRTHAEPPFCVAAAVCLDAVSFAPNRSICAYQESLLLDTWLRRSRRRPTL